MNVLIDTNIYYEDLTLSKPEFDAILTYLNRTEGALLMPEVIKKELKKHVKRRALQDYSRLRSTIASKLGLINDEITEDVISAELQNRLDKKLSRIEIKVLTHEHIKVDNLLFRSLEEIPPFQASDKGLRDSMIWLCLLEFLKNNPSESVALITKNTQDFGNVNLKEELERELKEIECEGRFIYCSSLGDFLSEYDKPPAYINEDFITDAVADTMDMMGTKIAKQDISFEVNSSTISYDEIESVKYSSFELAQYYVYRDSPREHIVYVDISTTHTAYIYRSEGTYRFNTEARFDDMNWKSETAEKVIGYSTIELFVYVNRKSKKITKIEPAVKEEHRVIYAS